MSRNITAKELRDLSNYYEGKNNPEMVARYVQEEEKLQMEMNQD